MKTLFALIKRNNKIFFKDKAMFITSLITPLILLVLYVSFLANVYKDSFISAMPAELVGDGSLVNGLVAGQLVASLLAVSSVTVAFCSNLLMVQDKVSGARRDLLVAPIKSTTLSLAYFLSSASVTLIVSLVALFAGLVYMAFVGWYLSFLDVLLLIGDVVFLVLFGTALSSVINSRLKTNGQASAVGTIVSSGYGFLCGAYMPISNFPAALRGVISFLPGTYGTSLLRTHAQQGVYSAMKKAGFSPELIEEIKDSTDVNLCFFDTSVTTLVKYLILIGSAVIITLLYVLLCKYERKKKR